MSLRVLGKECYRQQTQQQPRPVAGACLACVRSSKERVLTTMQWKCSWAQSVAHSMRQTSRHTAQGKG